MKQAGSVIIYAYIWTHKLHMEWTFHILHAVSFVLLIFYAIIEILSIQKRHDFCVLTVYRMKFEINSCDVLTAPNHSTSGDKDTDMLKSHDTKGNAFQPRHSV
jgi:hypothetical protein